MMKQENNNDLGNMVALVMEAYDYAVAARMAGRAGSYSPIGGKGNAFEIMYMDQKNLENLCNVENLKTQLTKSSTATQVDLVTMNGSKVFERIQCKDTPSISGTAKTIQQVKNGQYRGAQLVGTTESASAYNREAIKSGVLKQMKDSGISTKDTARISNKFNGVASTTGVSNIISSSAKLGGALSGTFALADSIISGDDFEETTKNVATSALKGAASSAVGTAIGETTMLTLATIPMPLPAKAAIVLGTTFLGGTIASEIAEDLCDGIGEIVGDVADGIGDIFDSIFGIL